MNTDLICQHWVFDKDPQIPVFTEGTDKMDRDDMHAYRSRCSTKKWAGTSSLVVRPRETLQRLGLEDIVPPIWQHTIYCLRKEWER